MKATGITRPVDPLGRVVIPVASASRQTTLWKFLLKVNI